MSTKLTKAPRAAEIAEMAIRANRPRSSTAFRTAHHGRAWANCPAEYGSLRPLQAAHDLLARSVDKEVGLAALQDRKPSS